MSLKPESKHYKSYHDHISGSHHRTGTMEIVYDLISDISDRRGLKSEWNKIDGDVQDEIIARWAEIVSKHYTITRR